MARSRNIKPGFFDNEELGSGDPLDQLLFAGLWLLADRAGRLENRPLRIKAAIFPYREGLDVVAMLDRLRSKGFLTMYQAHGLSIISINNFAKHQNPHKNERESELPDISEACNASDKIGTSPDKIGTTRADSLIPDSGFLIPDTPAPAGKVKKPPRAPRSDSGLFSEFWSAYPNKVAKAAAEKAWNKINPDKPLFDEIMAGLDRARGSPSWTKDGGQFIPHPATWLNGKRWTDAPVTVIGRHDLRGMDYTKGVGEDGSF